MTKDKITRNTTTLDATGQSIGRLASVVSKLLQGKHKPTYAPNVDMGDFVEVKNAGKVKVTGAKIDQKAYYKYSGYPGGLKVKQLKEVMAKDPSEALLRAVYDMLPKNRLRKERFKRFKVTND
jgi:large subunit ribosomal protein L13